MDIAEDAFGEVPADIMHTLLYEESEVSRVKLETALMRAKAFIEGRLANFRAS